MTHRCLRARSLAFAATATLALLLASAPAFATDVDLKHLTIDSSRIQNQYPFDETVYWQARNWPEYDATCTSSPCASGKLPLPPNWGCSPANPAADGVTDSGKIDCAVDKAPNNSVIYLPPGTYEMPASNEAGKAISIQTSNRVLRCEDPNNTKITIRSTQKDGGCTYQDGTYYSNGCSTLGVLMGSRNLYSDVGRVAWTGGYNIGERVVTVANAAQFELGDWIMLHMDRAKRETCRLIDSAPVGANTSAEQFVNLLNHTAKIVGKSGNTLTLDRGLRMDYNETTCGNKTAERFRPVENVGVEGCGFITTPQVPQASLGKHNAATMQGAASSWIVGSRFTRFRERAALIQVASRNWIQGNIFEDVQGSLYNTETLAVNFAAHDNVIENNIFYQVSVASKQENGQQGNVTAYNYIRQAGAVPQERSLFHHGRYGRGQLWEGNDSDTEMVSADRWWGRNGPGIVLFRNRLVGDGARSSITVNRDKEGSWITAEDMTWLGNTASYYFQSPQCGNGFPTCMHSPYHDIDDKVVKMHVEKNLYRANYGWQMSSNNPQADCGTGLGDCPGENPGSAPLSGTNLQANKAPLSWGSDEIPHSLYRSNEYPSWWCEEACTWGTVHAGPGAWGDDFSNPASLCKLPAQILWEGGTCTPMSGTSTGGPPTNPCAPGGSAEGSALCRNPVDHLEPVQP